MAIFKPLADAEVEAIQWRGAWTDEDYVPGWLSRLASHEPSDMTIHVPCWNGTFAARPRDWIVRSPDGTVNVISDDSFRSLYDADNPEDDETTKAQKKLRAEAGDDDKPRKKTAQELGLGEAAGSGGR
jgi:hypothetical protein